MAMIRVIYEYPPTPPQPLTHPPPSPRYARRSLSLNACPSKQTPSFFSWSTSPSYLPCMVSLNMYYTETRHGVHRCRMRCTLNQIYIHIYTHVHPNSAQTHARCLLRVILYHGKQAACVQRRTTSSNNREERVVWTASLWV